MRASISEIKEWNNKVGCKDDGFILIASNTWYRVNDDFNFYFNLKTIGVDIKEV